SEPKYLAKGSDAPSHPLIARTLVDAHAGSCTEVEALRIPVDRHGDGRVAQLQISSAHPPRLVAEHPGGPCSKIQTRFPRMVKIVGFVIRVGSEHLKTTSTREFCHLGQPYPGDHWNVEQRPSGRAHGLVVVDIDRRRSEHHGIGAGGV